MNLSQTQVLILWALLAKGGSSAAKELKPEVKRPDREILLKAGFITSERRAGGAIWLEVTDKGWAWAADNLSAPLPNRSMAGSAILRDWLERLQAFMRAKDITLAEVLGPQATTAADGPELSREAGKQIPDGEFEALRQRIRKTYVEVTGGFNKRALLKDLRKRLTDVDRSILDETLKRMQRDNEASLMQLDNRLDITEADSDAAVRIGREPRHILWIPK
jgi:hypothetical protein